MLCHNLVYLMVVFFDKLVDFISNIFEVIFQYLYGANSLHKVFASVAFLPFIAPLVIVLLFAVYNFLDRLCYQLYFIINLTNLFLLRSFSWCWDLITCVFF